MYFFIFFLLNILILLYFSTDIVNISAFNFKILFKTSNFGRNSSAKILLENFEYIIFLKGEYGW